MYLLRKSSTLSTPTRLLTYLQKLKLLLKRLIELADTDSLVLTGADWLALAEADSLLLADADWLGAEAGNSLALNEADWLEAD